MKWFYNLRRHVRNIIAGAICGAFIVAACIVVGIYGEHTENAPPAVAVVVVAIFIAAIIFTVFASVATAREKAAARQAERQAKAEQDEKERARRIKTVDQSVITAPPENDDADDIRVNVRIINNGCNLPLHTKAVGVTFGEHQAHIAASKVSDPLIIKHAPFGKFAESTDIINARTGDRVGHIKKELALELLDEFGAGFVLDGEIVDITGGTDDAPNYGCNIKINAVSGV